MPDLTIHAEIQGLCEDENENPCPGGIAIKITDLPDEGFQEKYNQLMEKITPASFLEAVGLSGIFRSENCRIITPEEYDALYGGDE